MKSECKIEISDDEITAIVLAGMLINDKFYAVGKRKFVVNGFLIEVEKVLEVLSKITDRANELLERKEAK